MATNTNTGNVMLIHSKNCYTNEHQCYIIWTMVVLFTDIWRDRNVS